MNMGTWGRRHWRRGDTVTWRQWGCSDMGTSWGRGGTGIVGMGGHGDGGMEGRRDGGTEGRRDGGPEGRRAMALHHLGRAAHGRPRCPDRRRSTATSSGTTSPGKCGAAPGGAVGREGRRGNAGTRWGCGAQGCRPSPPPAHNCPRVSDPRPPPALCPAAGSGSGTAQEMAVGGGWRGK